MLKFNNSKLYQDMQTKVNEYFEQNGISKNGNWKNTTQYILTLSSLIGSWIVLFVLTPHFWISIWFYLIMGISIGILCILGHESVHNCFSSNRKFNNMVKYTLNFLGGSLEHYRFKHSIHHRYTNVLGLDNDINFAPMIRVSKQDKLYFWHKWQHLYTPFLYAMSAFYLVFDFGFLFSKTVEQFKPIQKTFLNVSVFWLSKLWHMTIFFIIPGMIVGFSWIIPGYLFMMMVAGLYLAAFVLPSHIFEQSAFIETQNNKIKIDWATLIVKTTTNYQTKNKILQYLTVGTNMHVVHSLFPNISFVHYSQLNPIIKQVCDKYNLKVNEFNTFGDAVKAHFRHLKNMSVE